VAEPPEYSAAGKAGHLGKGGSVMGSEADGEQSLNSGESPWPLLGAAERRVLDHQRKLHRWARTDPARRFGDVFNLIYDRATLLVAWARVAGNKGAMTSGVDKMTRLQVETVIGVEPFLEELRCSRTAASPRYRCGRRRSPSAAARSARWGYRRCGTGWRRWPSS
jgi:hypothetical protein